MRKKKEPAPNGLEKKGMTKKEPAPNGLKRKIKKKKKDLAPKGSAPDQMNPENAN